MEIDLVFSRSADPLNEYGRNNEQGSKMIRISPIAGSWYEGSKESLENQIRFLFLDEKFGPGKDPLTTPDLGLIDEEKFIGLISPHAGYVYSGR
ncbi:MAG: AmmeMemoRadiSam system protein B, partial [Candidatus Heimdallarchaeota archaeon]